MENSINTIVQELIGLCKGPIENEGGIFDSKNGQKRYINAQKETSLHCYQQFDQWQLVKFTKNRNCSIVSAIQFTMANNRLTADGLLDRRL